MAILIKAACVAILIVIVLCMWKTAEYFNTLPESNKYKAVLAWDLLILFFLAIYLIMRLIFV